jgi:type I restriction enzyme M protein
MLFIDARKLGYMEDRVHRNFNDEDIQKIAGTYHAWRGEERTEKYNNIKGFCKSAKLEEVREHEYILTPGRYVGIEDVEDDGEPFEEKMERLTSELAEQFAKSRKLEEEIRENLKGIGYEF